MGESRNLECWKFLDWRLNSENDSRIHGQPSFFLISFANHSVEPPDKTFILTDSLDSYVLTDWLSVEKVLEIGLKVGFLYMSPISCVSGRWVWPSSLQDGPKPMDTHPQFSDLFFFIRSRMTVS